MMSDYITSEQDFIFVDKVGNIVSCRGFFINDEFNLVKIYELGEKNE